jgi:hypothetical protein
MVFASLRAATYRASLQYYPALSWLLGLTIPKSVMQKQIQHWQFSVDKVNRRLDQEQETRLGFYDQTRRCWSEGHYAL